MGVLVCNFSGTNLADIFGRRKIEGTFARAVYHAARRAGISNISVKHTFRQPSDSLEALQLARKYKAHLAIWGDVIDQRNSIYICSNVTARAYFTIEFCQSGGSFKPEEYLKECVEVDSIGPGFFEDFEERLSIDLAAHFLAFNWYTNGITMSSLIKMYELMKKEQAEFSDEFKFLVSLFLASQFYDLGDNAKAIELYNYALAVANRCRMTSELTCGMRFCILQGLSEAYGGMREFRKADLSHFMGVLLAEWSHTDEIRAYVRGFVNKYDASANHITFWSGGPIEFQANEVGDKSMGNLPLWYVGPCIDLDELRGYFVEAFRVREE